MSGRRDLDVFAAPSDPLAKVVISYGPERKPEVVSSAELCEGMPRDLGRRDEEIPASLDRPAPGEAGRGELVVSGWCQEREGGPARPYFSAWTAGSGAHRSLTVRAPGRRGRRRRDRETAASAGYRAAVPLDGVASGEHDST